MGFRDVSEILFLQQILRDLCFCGKMILQQEIIPTQAASTNLIETYAETLATINSMNPMCLSLNQNML